MKKPKTITELKKHYRLSAEAIDVALGHLTAIESVNDVCCNQQLPLIRHRLEMAKLMLHTEEESEDDR